MMLKHNLLYNVYTAGDAPLWKTFWLLLVGGHLIILIADVSIFFGLVAILNSPINANTGIIVLWSSLLLYSLYCVNALWRCRRNTRWSILGYLGFGAGVINSAWLTIMLGMFLGIIFEYGQPSMKELLSQEQTPTADVSPARDTRPEDTTTTLGWIGLWNDKMLDLAEKSNNGSKTWTFDVFEHPGSESNLIGSILVTVKSQTAFKFFYRAEGNSEIISFSPDLYEQDWGYGPYMHLTFTERKNMWFKLPQKPLPSEGWINGKAISAGERVNILPIEENQIYKLNGKNIIVIKVDLVAIYYRPEQKADFSCLEDNPPPLKHVQLTKAPLRSLIDRSGHLKLTIVYMKGC